MVNTTSYERTTDVNGGAYSHALEEARSGFAAGRPGVMAAAAGADYLPADEGGIFRVVMMGAPLEITHPDGFVLSEGREADVETTIVLLHYLVSSSGPLDLTDPVRYPGLRNASPYSAAFHEHAERPLLLRFGGDGRAFLRAVSQIGGHPLGGRVGNPPRAEEPDPSALWKIDFLPHLPLGVRLGLAEETLPADCVILFPRRAGFVYHVEDLAVVGEMLSSRLLGDDAHAN